MQPLRPTALLDIALLAAGIVGAPQSCPAELRLAPAGRRRRPRGARLRAHPRAAPLRLTPHQRHMRRMAYAAGCARDRALADRAA
jgi:hypothetical protein